MASAANSCFFKFGNPPFSPIPTPASALVVPWPILVYPCALADSEHSDGIENERGSIGKTK